MEALQPECSARRVFGHVRGRVATGRCGGELVRCWLHPGQVDRFALLRSREPSRRDAACPGLELGLTLGGGVEVLPGGLKGEFRLVFKTFTNYSASGGGVDFSRVRDVSRATIIVHTLDDLVVVVE